MPSVDVLVLYGNDSLYAKYDDGTTLQLSPCGSVFLYTEAPPSLHKVQHLTRFATSNFKDKIMRLIHIRNQYAARPYLCKEILNSHLLNCTVGYRSVKECSWPLQATADFITHQPDGTVSVKSLDGLASLTLRQDKQSFTVKFLAEVNSSIEGCPRQRKALMDSSNREGTVKFEPKQYFIWQEQVHPVSSYPGDWNYPLQLALHADCLNKFDISSNNVTSLPASLPATCRAAHLHEWKPQISTDSSSTNWEVPWQSHIKVIYKKSVNYRIFQKFNGLFSVEVFPGDGSVIRPLSPTGNFFSHQWFDHTNGSQAPNCKIEERVYSSQKPPPEHLTAKLGYSVGQLIKQAAKFLELLSNTQHQTPDERCCWIETSKSSATVDPLLSNPAQVIETAVVPGTGKFKAYSNGQINILFEDRTILDMRHYSDVMSAEMFWYQIILPNGEVYQQSCNMADQNVPYISYVQIACHWAEWVEATPSERQTFYKDTIWDLDKRRAIVAEVEKIQRFHYILNKENIKLGSKNVSTSTKEELVAAVEDDTMFKGLSRDLPDAFNMIKDVLQQTSKTIGDIDGLLMKTKCLTEK